MRKRPIPKICPLLDELEEYVHVPEHRLLIAVLQRAVADYYDKSPTIRWNATWYLFSQSRGPMSVLWILEHLVEDPEGVREKLLHMVKSRKERPTALFFRVDKKR